MRRRGDPAGRWGGGREAPRFHVEHERSCRRAMFHVKRRPRRQPSSPSAHRTPLFHVKQWAGRSGSGPREPGRLPHPAATERWCLGLPPVLGLTPALPSTGLPATGPPSPVPCRAMASRGRCGRNGGVRRRQHQGVESLPAIPARTRRLVGRELPALPPSSSSSVPHPLLAPEPQPDFSRPLHRPATDHPAGGCPDPPRPPGLPERRRRRPMARGWRARRARRQRSRIQSIPGPGGDSAGAAAGAGSDPMVGRTGHASRVHIRLPKPALDRRRCLG